MASNASNVLMHYEFDPSQVRFSPVQTNKKGGKVVYVKYGQPEQPLLLQTPAMDLPFGVSAYTDKTTGDVLSHSLDLSFRGMDANPQIKGFYERMTHFDEVLVQAGVANSKAWLGKPMARNMVEEFYRLLVKQPKDAKWPPTMKCKLPMRDGQITAVAFDERNNKVPLDYITKHSRYANPSPAL